MRNAVILFVLPVLLLSQVGDKSQEIQTHSRQAQQYLRSNQPERALQEYAAILGIEPKNLDAHANMGTVLFFQGSYDKAAEQLRAALQLKPGIWKLQALLGIGERRTGAPAAAADLEAAFTHLTEDKIRVETGLELTELYYSTGDLTKAAAVAGTLRQLSPADPDILYIAHRIYSDLADETTLSLVMAAPDSSRMHQVMAQELARQGDTQAAIAQYREALKREPALPGAHFELAELLGASDSPENRQQVEQEYKAALASNPFDEKSDCRLGEIAFRQSDLKDAEEHYSHALKLQPRDADANLGLGKTLLAMHQPEKAVPLLEAAVRLDPSSALAHYRLGVAYRETGRAGDATRELAEFQKLKTMREKLESVYKEMRLKPKSAEAADPDVPQ